MTDDLKNCNHFWASCMWYIHSSPHLWGCRTPSLSTPAYGFQEDMSRSTKQVWIMTIRLWTCPQLKCFLFFFFTVFDLRLSSSPSWRFSSQLPFVSPLLSQLSLPEGKLRSGSLRDQICAFTSYTECTAQRFVKWMYVYSRWSIKAWQARN